MSSLPQPVPRARKPSKEVVGGSGGEGPPVKPVPRVRGSSSQRSLGLSSIEDEQKSGPSVEEGDKSHGQEQVGVSSSKENEPPSKEEDDDSDYMNMPVPRDDSGDSDDDDVDATTGRRLSNYLNIAPLPEPTNQQQQSNTESLTRTPSVTSTTSSSTTTDDKTEDKGSPDVYKFKPKNRAPARPPPGYKKLPPSTSSTSGVESNKDEDTTGTKATNFARNRPVLKKPSPAVPPPSLPTKPQPKVPAKPPRTRDKSSGSTPPLQPADISPLLPATTPPLKPTTPPLLSRPVIISKESLEKSNDSVINIETPPTDSVTEKSSDSSNQKSNDITFVKQHSSPVFPPRKAPDPPPPSYEQLSSKPDDSKKAPVQVLESSKASPVGPRKVARAAPPPPKVVKGQNTSPQDEPSSTETTPTTDRKAAMLKQTTPTGDRSPRIGTPTEDKPLQAPPIGEKPKTKPTGDKQASEPSEDKKTETEAKQDNDQHQGEESDIVLTRMNLFTVEMRRVEGQGFGLHIAEGYTQTSKGLEVQGVFVKDIVAGSPADNCGRIKESDMIIDIGGTSMVGASLDDAAGLLKNSGNIVKLKIGRTFSHKSKGDGCVDPPVNPIQEENDGLKAKIKSLEKELNESVKTVTDLTQALANVTVEKTKLDMKIKNLNDEVEKLQTASNNGTKDDKEGGNDKAQELQLKVDQLNETNSNLEKELRKVKEESMRAREELEQSNNTIAVKDKEIDQLKQELEGVNKELRKHKDEHQESGTEMASLRKEVVKLKNDVTSARNEKQTIEKTLSVRIIQLEKELEEKELKEKKSKDTESTDTIVKHETAKKAESPEIEIKVETDTSITTSDKIELKEETRDTTPSEDRTDIVVSQEAKDTTTPDKEDVVLKADDRSSTERSPSRQRPLSGVSIPEEEEFSFDELKEVNRLSNTKAVEKSKLTSKIKRNRPSKAHIRSMANLSPFPEEMSPLRVPEEDGDVNNKRSISEGQIPMVAPKPKPKPEDKAAVAPKPRPRPQARKKQQSPEHVSDISAENTKTPPGSPSPTKKPVPIPRTPSRGSGSEKRKDDNNDTDSSTNKRSSGVVSKQPVPIPSEKPTEGHERKSLIKSEDEESSSKTGKMTPPEPHVPAPKPKPKPSSTPTSEGGGGSALDSKIEALKRKDPSELTVKEKMILAQQAMAKQAELKSKGIPPPVRKRPPQPMRSDSVDVEGGGATSTPPTTRVSDNMERSQSMDNIVDDGGEGSEETPKRQPKKLPPGAFKLGIPMGLPGDARARSNTFGSSSATHNEPSEEVQPKEKEEAGVSPDNNPPPSDNNTQGEATTEDVVQDQSHTTPVHQKNTDSMVSDDVADAPESIISSPDQSCQDTVSSHSNDEVPTDDEQLDNTSENLLETETTMAGATKADADQVLYWTSEVVSIWLTSIGLGQHAQSMVEKGVKGYMIFDFDNSKLKSLGMTSGDDRKVFLKEVKALKPFAEKLRKEHERQKKEEKKRLEQEKKLAKKKKK